MILNDVTLTYYDGEYSNIGSVTAIEFHDSMLILIANHGVNLSIPMKNIRCIHIERRILDAGSTEDKT